MNNKLFKIGALVVLTMVLSAMSFAQATWYVSNTNGDDLVFNGQTATTPFKTIGQALTSAASGDIISVAADLYTEANVSITKSITINGTAFNGLTTVTIKNGVTINKSGATVNIGLASNASIAFNLGSTATALVLTAGQLNIDAQTTVASTGTISRSGGTINATPTTTNVNVTYTGTASLTAGPELPASLRNGTLTVNLTAAAATLTVPNNVTFTATTSTAQTAGAIVLAGSGNAAFNGTVAFQVDASAATNIFATYSIDNGSSGSLTFANPVAFTITAQPSTAVNKTTAIRNQIGTGSVTFSGGINPGSDRTGVTLVNSLAGTISIAGGTLYNTVGAGFISNDAGGTINFTVNTTLSASRAAATISNNNAASLIQVNGATLTLAGSNAITLTNAGKIISTAAGAVGSGTVTVTNTGGVTANSGGDFPNLTVSGTGIFILGANTAVYGNYTQTSTATGALTFGANTLDVKGNWVRSSNNPVDVTPGTGTLTFSSTGAQTFTPGASLSLYNMTVNKAAGAVSMGASVIVTNNLTITSGSLDMSDFNVNITGTGVFTNSGSSYSTTGNGYVIFSGTAGTITGTGTFGNMDIRVGAVNTVTATSNIAFSGKLYLRSGTLAMGANTLTITSTTTVPVPAVYRSISAATAVMTGGVAVAVGSKYDLYYFDDTTTPGVQSRTASSEWVAAGGINNLGVISIPSTNANTVQGPAAATTITGALTVASGQVLNLNNGGVRVLTASGSATHSIVGTVSGGTLAITGTAVVVNGSSVTADQAVLADMSFEPPNLSNNATLTVSNIKQYTGSVTIQGSSTASGVTATIGFAPASAIISGNYTQGNATLGPVVTLNMAATTSTHTGNLVVTNGTLTYTRGGSGQRTVGGNVSTANAGVLILGTPVTVTGTTNLANTSVLNFGAFTYTSTGAFTAHGTGSLSGTGTLNLAYGATAAFTPGATLTIPNLQIAAGANTVTLTGNGVTVSGAITFLTGTFDFNSLGVTAASTVVVGDATVPGGFGGFANTGGLAAGVLTFTGAAGSLTLNQNITLANLTVNSTGSFSLVTGDPTTPTQYTLTVSGALTQTAGDISLDINDLVLTGATFSRTAGNWLMTNGYLTFNNAGIDFVSGTGWSVDNLEIKANVTNATDNKAYTVNKSLYLSGGTLTFTAAAKLTLGDGGSITMNGGAMSRALTPAGVYDVTYKVGGVVTSFEIPAGAAVLRDLNIDGGGIVTVKAGAAPTINRTLALLSAGSALEYGTNANTVTLVAGGRLKFAAGTDITNAGAAGTFTTTTYHLEYTGGTSLTTNFTSMLEFPASTTKILSLTISTTGGAVVTLNGNKTLNSDLVINAAGAGGGLQLSQTVGPDTKYWNLTVKGNVTITKGGFVTPIVRAGTGVSSVRPMLTFAGTTPQTFTVPAAGYTFSSGVDLTPFDADVDDVGETPAFDVVVNNTAAADVDKVVTLAGGNVTMGAFGVVHFTSGVIVTGSLTNPYQYTWTLMQGNSGAFNQPTQGFDRTLATGAFGHFVGNVKKFVNNSTGTSVDRSIVTFPVGTLPASPGNYRAMSIYFKSAPGSAVNVTVSMINSNAGGKVGFPILTGGLTITNYPPFFWYVKTDVSLAPSYLFDMEAQAEGYADYAKDGIQNVRFVRRDSGLVSNQWVMQKNNNTGTVLYDNSTINATTPDVKVIDATGGLTTQGSIFTYSQINKPPFYTAALGNVAKNEGDTLTFTYVAGDPDLGDVVTMSAVTLPTGATFNATTGVMSWIIPYTVATAATPTATQTITIRATDTYGPLTKDTTITVTITNVNRAPVFSPRTVTSTIKDTDTLKTTLAATDADGNTVTYSYLGVSPATTNAPAVSGTQLTWKPVFADAGKTYAIKVLASDGVASGLGPVPGTDTLTVNVTVNRSIARGDVDKNGTVQAADAALVLKHVAGTAVLTDAAALYAADASNNGTVTAYDAALILQAAAGLITLPASADTKATLGKEVAVAGSLNWASPEATSDPAVVSVGLKLSNAANVYSAQLTSTADFSALSIEGVNAALPEGWQMQWNVSGNELRIAMAGTTPLASGDIATLTVRLKNKESRLNFSTDALLNENFQSLGAVEIAAVPTVFALEQNYPNPFNPSTTIKYQIPNDANVNLVIYNVQGQQIRTLIAKEQKAGYYNVVWDGRNEAGQTVSSGLYLYRVQAGSFVATHKMLMIK